MVLRMTLRIIAPTLIPRYNTNLDIRTLAFGDFIDLNMDFSGDSRFASFARSDFEYSRVENHPLIVSVLSPKKTHESAQRQAPVLVFWHGGGFVVGGRLYEPWWSEWLVLWQPCLGTETCSNSP